MAEVMPAGTASALRTWLAKPPAEKRRSLRYHFRRVWNRVAPDWPLPLRLDPGIWWIARNDAVSDALCQGVFDPDERAFLREFLKPGMVVLDVGAHAGFYTMLASKRVGPAGRVISFEPSPRERERLQMHLRLNRCANVTVEGVALGDAPGHGELFVFEGRTTGCNSFHLGSTNGARPVTVPIQTLDEYMVSGALDRVDLVKMDIEGAERSALRGAEQLFRTRRPVLLCELHEKRTAPWGYRARDIVDLVASWEYRWHMIEEGGRFEPIGADRATFFGNGVAFPAERPWVRA
jgi:FkbM family methyltransferase